MKPYIGVSAVMFNATARVLLEVFELSSRQLMIGTVASFKTLQGRLNSLPHKFPPMLKMASIFPDDPRAFNLIHYNTRDFDTLFQQLAQVTIFGGSNLHGLQLNLVWPPADALRAYREAHPEMKLVLQIDQSALDEIDQDTAALARRLRNDYHGLIDAILLDQSRGRGIRMDTAESREYLHAIQDHWPELGLGVAGGVGPDTLHLVEPLFDEFSNLSTDVESEIRDDDDHLDIPRTIDYLERMQKMLTT